MPERDSEVFSNPLPPTDFRIDDEDDEGHPLTNDDFRKMLMTPRAPTGSVQHSSSSSSSSTSARLPKIPIPARPEEDDDDPATKRRKKKSYYAKLKRLEEERQKELEEKYRDRARERRDGLNRDYAETEIISTTADYRAVAPDAKAGENYAERRKQLIQESKYLGGDMEHTHLVKGLDFALLEKVRAEIHSKEREDEEVMEMIVSQPPSSQASAPAQNQPPAQAQAQVPGQTTGSVPAAMVPPAPKKEEKEDPETLIQFKTKMGRNVYRILFKNKLPERNELFLPRRMAYVVDLEDEYADLDVPTTTIRSKADCPSLEATTTLTTNDIVINKLTQILSYLRQGRRESKKLKKKEKGKLKDEEKPKEKLPGADDNIYADAGDYVPSVSKSKDRKDRRDRGREDERESRREREYRDRDRDRDRERNRDRDQGRDRDRDRRDRGDRGDRDRERDRGRDRERESHRERDSHRGEREERKKKSYFEKPSEEDEEKVIPQQTASEMVKSINASFKSYAEIEEEKASAEAKKAESWMKKLKAKVGVDSYAECYPGMEEAADAFGDSDDEVDYSKMDQGNKKGPIGRWDFDTQEEYSDYMANKEALPKAAFQYGVKMADGRKTRRAGPKDEKAELDRQWQKIQNILQKRKTGEAGHDVEHKKKKH
ncbi:protein Red-like [Ylistrum balloti]|uniref:protein Red-like n=1 Tax=Ylistrum balloti TaxID=509963 RepID=UPI002905A1D1|nr:protein Red-like [Ylistrum balloti]